MKNFICHKKNSCAVNQRLNKKIKNVKKEIEHIIISTLNTSAKAQFFYNVSPQN